jgi:long-chain acyl-CoA synthetase
MEQASHAGRERSRHPLLAELDGGRARDAADLLPILDQALTLAGAPAGGAPSPFELDEAVLRALLDTDTPDAVLERLDLQALAGLAERVDRRLAEAGATLPEPLRRAAWDLLDLVRRSSVLRRIVAEGSTAAWAERILRLVDRSGLTVGPLFRRRAETYGSKALFEIPSPGGGRTLNWRQAAARVDVLGRGLLSLQKDGEPLRVAILSENRVEMALVDLACLTSGIVNVLIPANATESDVGYMLGHSGAQVVAVASREQLRKIRAVRDTLPRLAHVVALDSAAAAESGVLTLDALAARSAEVPGAEQVRRSEAVTTDELATIMYTSGTTGMPKGIQFSQRNLVYKRFCRALAIPEIGEGDVFLCYLPLYHTFGRFLEMLGCVFWGATYCFLDNPSVEALVQGMRRWRPSVFISVPKKWIQLHEVIAQATDVEGAPHEEILEAVRQTTGGRLRWGLSAAGHLNAEIFRFFQRYGVELMSGFGMTEATGGITMTPPGTYKDDSLGCALPGVELKIAEDGELLVRGPYVMLGYLDPPDGEPSFDAEGWLHTGDLMEMDTDGFIRLVDRKKEIYKNIKGETIAPQRVENLFRDFESVNRIFLVGDHREYNTALIHPNLEFGQADLRSMSRQELKAFYRSLVVSVNKFLSPYERIVDFAMIERDLDPERGELTPKGTPRRKVVERNFADVIRLLYRRAHLRLGGVNLTFPNWLFQALGLTSQDLQVGEETVALPTGGAPLLVRRATDTTTQVGSCLYTHPRGDLNLGVLLTTPRLWLGNEALVEFAPLELQARERPGRAADGIEWKGRVEPYPRDPALLGRVRGAAARTGFDLMDLHAAGLLLGSDDDEVTGAAVRLLERVLVEEEDGALAEPARLLLGRAATSRRLALRRRAFRVLVPAERESRFAATLQRFLDGAALILDAETTSAICERTLPDSKFNAFLAAARRACDEPRAERTWERRAASLLRFLAVYGAGHPTRFRQLRAFFVHTTLFAERDAIRREATAAMRTLEEGFRHWLGPSVRIAVDPETGQEYRWEDVVSFDDAVSAEDRGRLLDAIQNTPLLREATFLFASAAVRLNDVPPGGVWIRLLGSRHGKSVYRVTLQTRFQGAYDLAVNVNHGLDPAQVQEEICWLILCGEAGDRGPLVEDFGGFWPDYDLWSEEFIAGETLDRALRRLARKSTDDDDRLRQMWTFLAWSALAAYVDFWNRTGRRWELADAGLTNVIAPTHDYHTGARIVSLSARRPFTGLIPMVRSFMEEFVRPVEERFPALAGIVGWDVPYSSVLEVVGEDEGLRLFAESLERRQGDGELRSALEAYLATVKLRGFLPMRLFFAAKRYRRWARLSDDATPAARARTLQELWDTYGLRHLSATYPEARVRFFRETVFQDTSPQLAQGLEEIIAKLRRGQIVGDALVDALADLRSHLDLEQAEDYFLARLSYPHLRPEDAASFIQTDFGGRHQSEMVVTLEDEDGNLFQVRHALNPKEVGRLYRLFLAAKLDVVFRPEHQYLVALSDRGQIIAGIYYEVDEAGRSAHLEKIVVAERYRQRGVADGLMKEFFNRLKAAGIRTVTTGFFRPEYFYGYGFSIEKRYAGLVKNLEQE